MYTIELNYLDRDSTFMFKLADELREVLAVADASGGAVVVGGKAVGREGCIRVETDDLDDLRLEVECAVNRLRTVCGVRQLNLVIKADDNSIVYPYLPPILRDKK